MSKQNSPKTGTKRKGLEPAERLLASLRHADMLRAGERVAVAVSGGADSVALLLLLLELREELGIVLSVAHLNHKLRGRAADADERFVAGLAAKCGLEFFCEQVDVAAKARGAKANLEDAARRTRNEFFARLVAQEKVHRVAVAHTADDQAETVLAHILRGTGLAGLGGIHPATESVIRPLLHVRRAELRAYLRGKKQKWREDATNQDTSRMRARIRRKLLPVLEQGFQPGVVEHLCTLAEFAREDEKFLDWMARKRCEALSKKEGRGVRIAVADLLSPLQKGDIDTEFAGGIEKWKREGEFEALTKRMVRSLMEERKPGEGQITAQHIAAVVELARHGQNGKTLQMPGGAEVRREQNELLFCASERRGKSVTLAIEEREAHTPHRRSSADYEYKIDLREGTTVLHVPQAGCVLRLRVIDWAKKREETSNSGAVLDRERLRLPLALRNWRPGDRMQPQGHQKAHKLKRLLNEKHVSRWERDGWPVLTSGGVLVWARGFPVAAGCAPNEGTREGILVAEEMT
ncbi:MAG TPA: tRNA lysidine(34) synthetase TilS [Candidatus Methylomirabilis sp.]|nr:tRNA lysidine(34) synthetase TilS [Candidatus Methylomirabilis sp.]